MLQIQRPAHVVSNSWLHRLVPSFGFGLALALAPFCSLTQAQQPAPKPSPMTYGEQPSADSAADVPPENYAPPQVSPVPLEWTPPALQALSAQAAVKTSFTLDRTLLQVAAGLLPDGQGPDGQNADRRAINKLDGVSVHFLRFGARGIPDQDAVNDLRAAYHVRGWKHVVTSTGSGGPVRDQTTDIWVVLDGANVRGTVILAETPQSLTLVTIAGNINPVDLLRLRGHFGIPRFNDDDLHQRRNW